MAKGHTQFHNPPINPVDNVSGLASFVQAVPRFILVSVWLLYASVFTRVNNADFENISV